MTEERIVSSVKIKSEMLSSAMSFTASNLSFICRLTPEIEYSRRSCFFDFVQSKFRRSLDPTINQSSIGPRSKLKVAGHLCLGFSGGIGSSVLLDLVYSSFFEDDMEEKRKTKGEKYPAKARVWEKAYVVWIDLSCIYPEVRPCAL